MAQKKQFSITTPRGSITTVQTDGGIVTAKLEWNPAFASQKAGSLFQGAGICRFRMS